MSEEDKLFNFLMNLQSWAQSKLRRQDVGDLNSAIAIVVIRKKHSDNKRAEKGNELVFASSRPKGDEQKDK
ncbi:unnamed protein product [Prunus armeniaca]